jgi:hypothetical protein
MGKLLLTFATITATILLASVLLYDGIRPDHDLIAFKTWMARHGKTYNTETEFAYRLNVYKRNALYVAEHNARHAAGIETFDLEMNLFADMEINEFADKYTMKNFKVTTKCSGGQAPTNSLPDAVDWSAKGNINILFRRRHSYQKPRTMWIMLGLLNHWIARGCQLPQEQESPFVLGAAIGRLLNQVWQPRLQRRTHG